jgi:invasion protein IalB
MKYNDLNLSEIASPCLGKASIRQISFVGPTRSIRSFYLFTLALVSCMGYMQNSFAAPPANKESDVQVFQDWSLRCIDLPPTVNTKQSPNDHVACEAGQTVTIDQDGKKIEILKLAISPAKDKAGKSDWALVALFPLDVLLNSDFGVSLGKDKPTLYRFRNCNHLGCFGVVPLDKATLGRFEKSLEGAVYFRLLTGKAVKVVFSLNGVGEAFGALQAQTKAEGAKSNGRAEMVK